MLKNGFPLNESTLEVDERGHAFEVRCPSEWTYRVLFSQGLVERYGSLFEQTFGRQRAFILADEKVAQLYARTFLESFQDAGVPAELLTVPAGEESKSLSAFASLLDELARRECDRRSVLVNFGGGMISDLGGFVASAYMRGIPYVNFSTSLLGQIDACAGGKVAVNTPHAKNLIGSFYHPRQVVGDPGLLSTLHRRDVRSGLAEGIKVGIIADPELFSWFEEEQAAIQALEPDILTRVIGRAVERKMELISLDPYEEDLRRPLNFGHSLAHPIESEFQYRRIRHGEAVAIGMGVATTISLERGWIAPRAAERIFDVLERYDLLDLGLPLDAERIVERVGYVRLIRGKRLNFVLPEDIGRVRITEDLDDPDLVRGIQGYLELVAGRRT